MSVRASRLVDVAVESFISVLPRLLSVLLGLRKKLLSIVVTVTWLLEILMLMVISPLFGIPHLLCTG